MLPAELVDQSLSRDVFDDVLIVIVSHGSGKLVEVHSGFVLPGAPESGKFS